MTATLTVGAVGVDDGVLRHSGDRESRRALQDTEETCQDVEEKWGRA